MDISKEGRNDIVNIIELSLSPNCEEGELDNLIDKTLKDRFSGYSEKDKILFKKIFGVDVWKKYGIK